MSFYGLFCYIINMENMIKNSILTIQKGEGRALKAGGAWIYDNEVESITGTFTMSWEVLATASCTCVTSLVERVIRL